MYVFIGDYKGGLQPFVFPGRQLCISQFLMLHKKYGVDSLHLISRLPGLTISVSLRSFSGVNLCSTYLKFYASSGATLSCQYPYLMPCLEKYHRPVSI